MVFHPSQGQGRADAWSITSSRAIVRSYDAAKNPPARAEDVHSSDLHTGAKSKKQGGQTDKQSKKAAKKAATWAATKAGVASTPRL